MARVADHPRSRGVYPDAPSRERRLCGSSPLARGLLLRGIAHRLVCRIIPARAGFTCSETVSRRWRWDHPRSRGVYGEQSSGTQHLPGSSPLARGLPHHILNSEPLIRIIPARAGFTRTMRVTRSQTKDHPRSRGVYLIAPSRAARGPGSSPLARGLHSCFRYWI